MRRVASFLDIPESGRLTGNSGVLHNPHKLLRESPDGPRAIKLFEYRVRLDIAIATASEVGIDDLRRLLETQPQFGGVGNPAPVIAVHSKSARPG